MSNDMVDPRILYCPTDLHAATQPSDAIYTQTGLPATVATNWAGFGPRNLSYFAMGDAQDKYPKMIFIGDRNIGTAANPAGSVAATAWNMVHGPYAANPGLAVKSVTFPPWEWTDTDLHEGAGNLGMVDGSVQQSSLGGLNNALNDTKNSLPKSLWPAGASQRLGNMLINMP